MKKKSLQRKFPETNFKEKLTYVFQITMFLVFLTKKMQIIFNASERKKYIAKSDYWCFLND